MPTTHGDRPDGEPHRIGSEVTSPGERVVPISETVDEQVGTRILVFETRITGLPLKGIVPGEGIVIRDAGWITELVTVVLDLPWAR